MAELDYSVFEPCDKKNVDDGENRQFLVKGSFQDLVDRGWSWAEFFAFLDHDDNIVWSAMAGTPEECCVCASKSEFEKPSKHEYELEFIVQMVQVSSTSQEESAIDQRMTSQKLKLTAPTVDSAASTLHGIFRLVANSKNLGATSAEVTLKCFATQPRTPIPILQSDLLRQAIGTAHSRSSTDHHNPISCMRFHFVSIDAQSARAINECGVGHVEFRQCFVEDGWSKLLASTANSGSSDDISESYYGLKRLSVSCTMPEFAHLGRSLSGNSTLEELDLLLHFWLQGPALEAFSDALDTTTRLKELKIQYLDINDKGWDRICRSLHNHPSLERLELGFTEKFVDNFRRLTPERRISRTKSVLALVQANLTITDIVWPEFQQDESTMQQVAQLLGQRNNR